MKTILATGAKTHGVLDQALTSQIDKDYGDKAFQWVNGPLLTVLNGEMQHWYGDGSNLIDLRDT